MDLDAARSHRQAGRRLTLTLAARIQSVRVESHQWELRTPIRQAMIVAAHDRTWQCLFLGARRFEGGWWPDREIWGHGSVRAVECGVQTGPDAAIYLRFHRFTHLWAGQGSRLVGELPSGKGNTLWATSAPPASSASFLKLNVPFTCDRNDGDGVGVTVPRGDEIGPRPACGSGRRWARCEVEVALGWSWGHVFPSSRSGRRALSFVWKRHGCFLDRGGWTATLRRLVLLGRGSTCP